MRARATCFIYMENLQTGLKPMYLDTRTGRETHSRFLETIGPVRIKEKMCELSYC